MELMSWHYLQVEVAESSHHLPKDIELLQLWKRIIFVEKSCFNEWQTDACLHFLSGMMQPHLMDTPLEELLILLPPDSHAKGFQSHLIKDLKKKTLEIVGQIQQELLTKLDQKKYYLKTYRELENTSELWPEILPISGTIVDGQLFQLELPEQTISEKDGGVWPTPTVNLRPSEGNVRILRKKVLNNEIAEEEARALLNGKSPFSAQGSIPESWPTPTASDAGGGIRDAKKGKKGWYNENKDGTRWGAIMRDAVPAHENKKGRINPDWQEWVMGWPTGWTDPEPINLDCFNWWKSTINKNPSKHWEIDPAEKPLGRNNFIPRLTEKKLNRSARLKACGNGQVPQQMLLAIKLLEESKIIYK